MALREFKGAAVPTTITGSIASSGGGSVSIADATGWPTGAGGSFSIVVDEGTPSEEKILVTSRSGTSLTFGAGGRGYDNTAAVAHLSNATIRHCLTAADLTEANAHVNDATIHLGTGTVTATHLASGAVTAGKIAAGGVSAASQLASDVVETAKIANGNVTTAKIADANVTTAKIADANVTTAKLADGSVTHAKKAALEIVRLQRSSSVALESNLTWDVEDEDDLGIVTVPVTDITLPASDGIYALVFRGTVASALTNGYVQAAVSGAIGTGGGNYMAPVPGSVTSFAVSFVFRAAASATVTLSVRGTGGNVTNCALHIIRLGAA